MEHNCLKSIGAPIILISKLILGLLEVSHQPWAGLLNKWAVQQQGLIRLIILSGPRG